VGCGGYAKKKWDFTPPPALEIAQVTQLPPSEPAPPRQPPFDDSITARTTAGSSVTVRFHADNRRLTPESFPLSEPLIIRSMVTLCREFGTNPANRYQPLEIIGAAQHPFRPTSYHSGGRTIVAIKPTTPLERGASTASEGNLLEIAIYDDPWTVIPDTNGQSWTAYGYLLLNKIRANGTLRKVKCYLLREDSNQAQRPMTERNLYGRLESALRTGYVTFDHEVRGQDTPEEEVRIFTDATTW
jgi:hypothetical protein